MAFSADGGLIATGADDRACRVWRTEGLALLKEIPHPGWVMSVQFARGGLVTGCNDGAIRAFDERFEPI